MYGGLQGLNKSETAAKHGEAQVKVNRDFFIIFEINHFDAFFSLFKDLA